MTTSHGDVLDCVGANVALLLARAGVPDPLPALGSQWTFELDGAPEWPLPVLVHTDLERYLLATVGRECGRHHLLAADPIGALHRVVEAAGEVVVYADAYALPWLPMYRRQHVEHTAVVTGMRPESSMVHVLDGYTAATDWGDAAPVDLEVPLDVLAEAIVHCPSAHRLTALSLGAPERAPDNPADLLVANARALTRTVVANRTVTAFADAYRTAGTLPEAWRRFELGCWLVARARAAHVRWLRSTLAVHAGLLPAEFTARFEGLADDWQQASRLAYLTRRRVDRGRPGAPALLDEVATVLQAREQELSLALADRVTIGSSAPVSARSEFSEPRGRQRAAS